MNPALQGKEVVSGSNPDYFRITGEDGKTTLLIPPRDASFDFTPDHPYYKNGGILSPVQKPDQLSVKPEPVVEDEPSKLVKYSYNDAHKEATRTGYPLLIFLVKDSEHIDYVNSIISELQDFASFKFFHYSVMDDTNPNFKKMNPSDDGVQLVVWFHSKKNGGGWVRKHYLGLNTVMGVVDRIRKWCRENISTKDKALQLLDRSRLFIADPALMIIRGAKLA